MDLLDAILAFLAILVISAVFSMFGKGGGSLYTPVLLMLHVAVGQAIATQRILHAVRRGLYGPGRHPAPFLPLLRDLARRSAFVLVNEVMF